MCVLVLQAVEIVMERASSSECVAKQGFWLHFAASQTCEMKQSEIAYDHMNTVMKQVVDDTGQ